MKYEHICPQCKKVFIRKDHPERAKYCSPVCANKAHGDQLRGVKLPETTRKKMSDAHKGDKKPWNIEKNKLRVGSKSNFWKGGITPEIKLIRTSETMAAWRGAVFARDKYACGFCGVKCSRKTPIEADHILPFSLYPELRYEISNGQTLCRECHKFKTSLDRIWYDNYTVRL